MVMPQSVPVQAAPAAPASLSFCWNCSETSARHSSSVASRPPASCTQARWRCTTLSSSSARSSIQARTSSGRATAATRRQALRFAVHTDMTPLADIDTRSCGWFAAPGSGASSFSDSGADSCEPASVEASARCEAQMGRKSGEALGSRRSVGTFLAMDSRTATRGVEMLSGTPRAYTCCRSEMQRLRCSSPQQPRTFSPVTIASTDTDGSALCNRRRPRSSASKSATLWGRMLTRTMAKAWELYGVSRQGPSAESQSVRQRSTPSSCEASAPFACWTSSAAMQPAGTSGTRSRKRPISRKSRDTRSTRCGRCASWVPSSRMTRSSCPGRSVPEKTRHTPTNCTAPSPISASPVSTQRSRSAARNLARYATAGLLGSLLRMPSAMGPSAPAPPAANHRGQSTGKRLGMASMGLGRCWDAIRKMQSAKGSHLEASSRTRAAPAVCLERSRSRQEGIWPCIFVSCSTFRDL
mmetsp:Transcript_46640/g.129759  ORF Transcript_46640/g.129759 Transcript_46640/m.129759 type:complete len:468 (+) Transcript_46640:138-1541(+)